MEKILRNKKGMSLIEILVGSMLLALVVITVTAAISPMLMAFTRANDIAEYNMVLDSVGNRITSDVAQASDRDFTGGVLTLTVNSEQVVYTVVDGHLRRNNIPVFPAEFYKGKQIDFSFSGEQPNFLVDVTVSSSGNTALSGAEITRSYAVRPLMMANS